MSVRSAAEASENGKPETMVGPRAHQDGLLKQGNFGAKRP